MDKEERTLGGKILKNPGGFELAQAFDDFITGKFKYLSVRFGTDARDFATDHLKMGKFTWASSASSMEEDTGSVGVGEREQEERVL